MAATVSEVAPALVADASWTVTGAAMPPPLNVSCAPASSATGVGSTARLVAPAEARAVVCITCPDASPSSSSRRSTPATLSRSHTSLGVQNRVDSVIGMLPRAIQLLQCPTDLLHVALVLLVVLHERDHQRLGVLLHDLDYALVEGAVHQVSAEVL